MLTFCWHAIIQRPHDSSLNCRRQVKVVQQNDVAPTRRIPVQQDTRETEGIVAHARGQRSHKSVGRADRHRKRHGKAIHFINTHDNWRPKCSLTVELLWPTMSELVFKRLAFRRVKQFVCQSECRIGYPTVYGLRNACYFVSVILKTDVSQNVFSLAVTAARAAKPIKK
jgi:hypothetical protein